MQDKHRHYVVGERVTVTLEKIYPYGVFVRLDANTCGFIRRRELSLSGDVDPRQCFAEGQPIDAVITSLPVMSRLLELSHRRVLPDPWQDIEHQFQLGAVVAATIKSLRFAGIYVEIMLGVSGFVPRAELPKWVEATAVEQIWWEGDQIEAVITRIDHADHLILLSIRQRLQQRTQAEQVRRFPDQRPGPIATEPVIHGTDHLPVFEPLSRALWPPTAQLNIRLAQLVEETKAELSILFHIDPASHIASVVTSSGALPFDRTRLADLLDSPIKDVIQEGEPVYDLRVSTEAKAKYRKLLLLAPFESCIGVPITVWGEVNHALFLFHRAQDAFSYYRVRDAQASAALCTAVLERERLEQRLDALAGLLLSGQLAAVLGHEVFNKMSGLELSLLNLQTDCDQLGSEVANLAASTKYQEMQQAVARLIDAHKSLKGTVTLFQQLMRTRAAGAIDVNAVINEAAAMLRPLTRKYGMKVEMKLDPALPTAYGNPLQLQQVFLNIMLNAVQQMAQSPNGGKRLEVTTGYAQDDKQSTIHVRFTDDGPGIHRRLWEKIFDLGFTTRTGGSGLGLYIARSLVEANGGTIKVEHSAIPLGTTFTVGLPASAEQEKTECSVNSYAS